MTRPLVYGFSQAWMESFAHRVGIDMHYFVVAFFIALLVAGLTLSFQTYKASGVHPTQTLKPE